MDEQPINKEVERELVRGGITTPKSQKKLEPVYKMVGASKIPVSKALGSVWKSRRNQAIAKRRNSGVESAWDEALRYYYNDQSEHRDGGNPSKSGNRKHARKLGDQHTETENIVYSNVNALVPMIYAKNPTAEVTNENEPDDPLVELAEAVLNAMSRKTASPGVNLKPKAKRAVVMTTLTNRSYIEIGWTFKEQSSDKALQDLTELSTRYQGAKTSKEVMEVEGAIQALESKVDILSPEGPWAKFRRPHEVLSDPDGVEDDLTDSNWMMIQDFIATEYLRAQFATKKKDSDEWESIYQPSHIMKMSDGGGTVDEEVNNFTLIDDKDQASSYGFDDAESYNKAQRTKVWWVWDKVTRRLFLYNDKDWTWPIWVWDDPYKLDTFFPLFPLSFSVNPEGGEAKGEVTYYLDQQDAINEINDEERRARLWAKRNIGYNTRHIKEEEAKKMIDGPDGTATGFNLPDGVKMSDVIFSIVPPSTQFASLFDPSRKFAAIDRIGGVNETMRGAQFKTNTTNDAVEYYKSNQATRLDDRIDAVEDCLSGVYWGLLQLAFQFLSPELCVRLIGKKGQKWQQLQPSEIQQRFTAQVAGGSSTKPTSNAKKQEALQIGQILGQFAKASPMSIVVALKVFERAYPEIAITSEDWQVIRQSIEAQLMQQQGGPTGAEGGGQPPDEAQIQQAVQALVQRGMSPEQATEEVKKRLPQTQ